MHDDSAQQDDQSPTPETGREFAARRTIIKGMASAVPVVMTIGCGQAMAQASSLRCIVEPPQDPTICLTDDELTSEDPKYVRIPLSDASQCAKTESTPNARNILLYVDSYGNPTNSSSGLPVTASCYCSFI